MSDTGWKGVPGQGKILTAARQYHDLNKVCIPNYTGCGITYNTAVYHGTDACGAASGDVFGIWKRNVDEKKAKRMVQTLMDHYDFPVYDVPAGLEREIYRFYQAKYGLFTCLGMHIH